MIQIVLGLGSNMKFDSDIKGKMTSLDILKAALEDLQKILINCKSSSVYKTKAMYVENQDDFLNLVVVAFTDLGPELLLEEINKIEEKYGRNREKEIRFGPRTLDIDIELYGDCVVNTKNLQIPHLRLKERAFVLKPLLEILPNSAEPISGKKLKDFLPLINSDDIQKIHDPLI